MLWFIVAIFIIVTLLFNFYNSRRRGIESFSSVNVNFNEANDNILVNIDDFLLTQQTKLKEQRLLDFFDTINLQTKERIAASLPKTASKFNGYCKNMRHVNQSIQNDITKNAYDSLLKSHPDLKNNFKQDPCVAAANYICEFTDPLLYLSQTRMPPRWLIKTLRDVDPPKNTYITCYNSIYDCCKRKKQSKPLDTPSY